MTMTEYESGLPVDVAFPADNVDLPLAKILADHGLRQFHTAETEKYAHVTFFFNGGRERHFLVKTGCWCLRPRWQRMI